MKSIRLTFHEAGSSSVHGRGVISFADGKGVMQTREVLGQSGFLSTSEKIRNIFEHDKHAKRAVWAELTISIDDIDLYFSLPEELDYVCEIFETVPFPTALTLANKDPNESRLNTHWLSRLPKKVKDKKYRERFIKYVNSAPKELRDFRSFYES